MPRQADRHAETSWRPPSPDPSLRIGDAERNQAAEALSQHYTAGRLDDAELKERLDRAMQAKTGADLSGLMDDLPPLFTPPPPPVPQRPRRRTGLWIVLATLLVVTALPHAPLWWPWWMAVRIPWIVVEGLVFFLWRRARRRRWQREAG
jgi:hypothetical protein